MEPSTSKGLSAHILPTSATMIGVCMTVLSIGRLGHSSEARLLIDKALAIDALAFLVSALLSFASMRTGADAARHERWAETVFIVALALLAASALALTFAIQ